MHFHFSCFEFFLDVQADETKAVDAVLKADTKRLAFLEECDKLEKLGEKATSEESDRLKEVLLVVIYAQIYSMCSTL